MCVTYGCVLDVEIEYKMILNDFFIKEMKEVKILQSCVMSII